jgi:branched-chain amino acid transport system permease protein
MSVDMISANARRSPLAMLRDGVTVSVAALMIGAIATAIADQLGSDYAYFAGYTILQYVLLATAWNILGGYVGYVNFGSAAFFAIGAYTTVALTKLWNVPLLLCLPFATILTGAIGLGVGCLTLRLRGVFFSIATLAFSIVLETVVVNWDFVGGARGAYIVRPQNLEFFGTYARFLFILMLVLTVGAVLLSRAIKLSWLGRGLAAIRDDEVAAECSGVPALRLKLFATAVSGALMGLAGAPFPYFISFVDPHTVFGLSISINAIAMPLVGGAGTWIGPVVGAVLLGGVQQAATVLISSSANLLFVGVILIIFVVLARKGLVGLFMKWRGAKNAAS